MSDHLTQLQSRLSKHFLNKEPSPYNCLSLYQCYKPQQLHSIPFNQPTLLLVTSGEKKVETNTLKLTLSKGDILLVPPGSTVWLGQYPDKNKQPYTGMAFRFDREALKHFRLVYGSSLDQWDISSQWQSEAPESILNSLAQWLDWGQDYLQDKQLVQHRQVELLLLLAQEGLIGNILMGEHPSWKQRVSQLLVIDPSRHWQMSEVCSRLAVSESSLRRKLQEEKCTFRELLEEVRLTSGLSMILETRYPIGQIAVAVGYQSQSRFGERFKRRFSMTPTELRQTLES